MVPKEIAWNDFISNERFGIFQMVPLGIVKNDFISNESFGIFQIVPLGTFGMISFQMKDSEYSKLSIQGSY